VRKVNRKSIYCLSAAAVALLLGGSATAATAYKTISVEVDGKTQTLQGFEFGTVADLLKKQGVQVGKDDLVQPTVTKELTDGTQIHVKHAKSIVVQDGTHDPVSVNTLADTVADVLKELQISVNDADKLSVETTSSIQSGQTIAITRRTQEVQVAEEAIPFQTERQPDANEYTGTEKVLTPGVEGKVQVTTTVYYENGNAVDRKEDRKTTAEAVNQVVGYGTKQRPIVVASRSGENLEASKSMTMAASAYSMPGSRTASGGAAGQGTVAVDPSVIPLGTRLYIEGYGYGVASDVGGAIKGNRIDLHFDTEAQALQFGRRTVQVYILN
jgi:uncharacterized protein YabE (DUF348 family)